MAHRTPSSQRALRHTAELALAVPQVVTHRLTRLALAGPQPSKRDRAEFHRMGTEKVVAFSQSWQAMGWAVWRLQLQALASAARLWWTPWTLAAPAKAAAGRPAADLWSVFQAGLAPVHRRAVANARRLGRAR